MSRPQCGVPHVLHGRCILPRHHEVEMHFNDALSGWFANCNRCRRSLVSREWYPDASARAYICKGCHDAEN